MGHVFSNVMALESTADIARWCLHVAERIDDGRTRTNLLCRSRCRSVTFIIIGIDVHPL